MGCVRRGCAQASVNADLTLNLFDFILADFRHGDGQYAVVHLGSDLVFDDVIGQDIGLLIVGITELAAQEVLLLVLLFVFQLVLDGDFKIAVGIDVHAAKFFCDASVKLLLVLYAFV